MRTVLRVYPKSGTATVARVTCGPKREKGRGPLENRIELQDCKRKKAAEIAPNGHMTTDCVVIEAKVIYQ